jgi:hypothetical protein
MRHKANIRSDDAVRDARTGRIRLSQSFSCWI